jgi:hypothetical protein
MSESGTSQTSRRDPVKSAYEVKAVVQRTSSEGATTTVPIVFATDVPDKLLALADEVVE